jgi:hypothetical protein
MSTAPINVEPEDVKPLSFLLEPAIYRENKRLLEEEERHYRALGWWERFKLRRYVNQLRRRLRHYNALVIEQDKLKKECVALKARLDTANGREREKITQVGREKSERGRVVTEQLAALSEDHSRFQHYAGWLDYERKNRKELLKRAKAERQIRKGMDKEAKWIKTLMIDVFKHTEHCHLLVSDGKGKTRAKAPKFFKVQTAANAHYFWLDTSRKTLFGWRWMLPYKVNVDSLIEDTTIHNLAAAVRRDVKPMYTNQGQLIFRVSRLDLIDALPNLVRWSDSREFYPEHRGDYLPYTLGCGENKKFEWFDFGRDPHLLLGGKSQSGKSNVANGIIGTLVNTHTPDELRIVLIDQKGGLEFTHWTDIPHLLWNVGKVLDDVKPMLTRVIELMRKRMELLEAAKKKKIDDYNRIAHVKLARVVVVIDEMAGLSGLGALTEELHNLIMMITSQGRAVGIHLICATQYPEVKIVPGRLKANMSIRVSGAMPSTTASMVILDIVDAAKLPNIPGRIIAVSGMRTLTLQAPLITDDDIEYIVRKAQNDYPEVDEELWELSNVPKLKVWDELAVVQAALDWNSGGLSGSTIHRLLGDESPGERHLRRICKRVIDRAAGNAGVVEYQLKAYRVEPNTKGKGYTIKAVDSWDGWDGSDMGNIGPTSVPTPSEPDEPSQPLDLSESAAD